jgi:hypothetical protein
VVTAKALQVTSKPFVLGRNGFAVAAKALRVAPNAFVLGRNGFAVAVKALRVTSPLPCGRECGWERVGVRVFGRVEAPAPPTPEGSFPSRSPKQAWPLSREGA